MSLSPSQVSAPTAEALFAAIVESTEDAIVTKDLQGTITSWNPGAARIFGYRADEAVGRPATILAPSDRENEEETLLARVRRGEAVTPYHTVRRHKNGRVLDVTLTISALRNGDGKIVGALEIARDVTEHRRLQDRFRITLSSIGDAVVCTDVQGRVTFMNRVAEELTGWKEPEAMGQPIEQVFKIVNESTLRPVDSPISEVLRNGAIVGLANHTILISRAGREIPIDDSAAPIRGSGGQLFGVVLVFRDVSERRAAQLASIRLAAIVENSDDAIISKNLKGIITSWNTGAQRIFGYTPEEAVGRSITLLIPVDRQHEEQDILARLQRGERVDHFETVRVRKDGREINVSVTISPIRDPDGTIIGASKIARDVTAQKDAERALRQAQTQLQLHAHHLEAEVRERTRALQDTVAELDAFSYSLSHDLRAPLRAIQGFTEAALDDFGQTLPPTGAEYLRKAIGAAGRMDRLIQDVLAFSRLSREQISIGPVDLEKVIDEVVADRPEFQAPRAEITVVRPLLPVLGHESSLLQALSNLMANAVKFVAPGVVPRVRIATSVQREAVRVSVTDNGIGIDGAARGRLFRIFERIPTQHRYEGTGIGLAIVRKAAERMRGRVGVDSTPGEGSTFWIELPAVRP